MEELKIENTRLQRMVDVLDAQPELVFCVTARGDVTYVSERTVSFMKISQPGVAVGGGGGGGVGAAGEESDEDPAHLSQMLSKESVDCVLSTIQDLLKESPKINTMLDASVLFASKV